MRIFFRIYYTNIGKFNIEILINRYKFSHDRDVILQLDGHLLAHKSFKKGKE